MKIYIKRFNKEIPFPKIIEKGDWIDLCAAETVTVKKPIAGIKKRKTLNGITESTRDVEINNYMIPLGVAMQLPKGYEAIVLPRSGTYKKYGIILANSMGVIDNTYCGNDDQWWFNAIFMRDSIINKRDRICQFRIQLSQKATIWQKIKWFFTNKIELIEVENLDNVNRNGFGSTGK